MKTTQSLVMALNEEEDDDDLLNLDLDDDTNKILSSNKKDEDIFKQPEIPNFMSEKNDEIISTFSSNKTLTNEQQLLNGMFLNNDEDEEDLLIASQIDLISSTQMNGKKQSPVVAINQVEDNLASDTTNKKVCISNFLLLCCSLYVNSNS
jgi:hypothetical protein